MAPDLSNVTRPSRTTNAASNSVSSTQASPNLSRRTSSVMAPPPVPQNSSLPNSPRPPTVAMDNSGYGGTTGPIRHPRPLTAAELHLELEKEQESIARLAPSQKHRIKSLTETHQVNRLTRELSALRAQTASVASTTSSTSDLFTTNQDSHLYPYQTGITPTSGRRHRSSSNLSSRSARSARDALANSASVTSVSGVAAPRDRDRDRDRDTVHSHQASSRPSMELPRPDMSRQNSMSGAGVYRSGSYTTPQQPLSSSPAWTQPHGGGGGQHQSSRHSVSSSYSNVGGATAGEVSFSRSPSSNAVLAATRYEEAAVQRSELEAVKRENEALKLRIRELERSLHGGSNVTGSNGGGVGTVNGEVTVSALNE